MSNTFTDRAGSPSAESALTLDDPRVIQYFEQYRAQLDAGQQPDRRQLLQQIPELGEELNACLDGLEYLFKVAPQLQQASSAASGGQSLEPLGDFRLIREIGRGGMGIVYEAEQVSLGRRVAVKVLPYAGALDGKSLQRFKNEAHAAAQLKHPNIVSVHFVGCERGVHYYAMELVEGPSLAEAIANLRLLSGEGPDARNIESKVLERSDRATAGEDEHGTRSEVVPRGLRQVGASRDTEPAAVLSTARSARDPSYFQSVARLGIQAADALEFAHQMGIVHRDIKPSNLLVDADGHLRVTDFGLAITADSSLTVTGDVPGTLRYMSPEQAEGRRGVMDHRTDVYSLGVTLYELLTLRPAFPSSNRQELLRQISQEDPTAPHRLNSAIPKDMETIVLKAMGKEPRSRYGTSIELAEELRRFLDNKPIRARPPSLLNRFSKWSRRHKPLVSSLTAAFAIVLASSAIISGIAADRERSARLDAERARNQSVRLLAYSYMDKGQTLCEQGEIGAGMLWLAHALESAPADAVPLQRAIRRSLGAWSRQLHWQQAILEHSAAVNCVAFSPDGKRIVTGCRDATTWIWDVATSKPIAEPWKHPIEKPKDQRVTAVAFSAEGDRVVAGCESGKVRIWDVASGQRIGGPLDHGSYVMTVAFSPDGGQVLTGSHFAVRLWDVVTQKCVREHVGKPNWFFPVGDFDGESIRTLKSIFGPLRSLQLWDLTRARPIGRPITTSRGFVWAADVTSDASRIAIGWWNGRVATWDVTTGRLISQPMQHGATVWDLAFSPDDSRILTAGMDRTARVWDAASGEPLGQPLRHQRRVNGVAFSPDGSLMASVGADRAARLWKVATSQVFDLPVVPAVDIPVVAFSPDGSRIAMACHNWSHSTDRIIHVPTGQMLTLSRGGGAITAGMAFNENGSTLARGDADNVSVTMWDAATGQPAGEPLRHEDRVNDVAFSPDGSRIVTGCKDHAAYLWDATAGTQIPHRMPHHDAVTRVAFSPDGSRILTGCSDSTVWLWDATTLEPVGQPLRHNGQVVSLAFGPDGTRFLTGQANGTARVWNVADMEPIGRPIQHATGLEAAAFSPDGSLIATGGLDGTARIWDAITAKAIGPPIRVGAKVSQVVFTPDGRWVLAAGHGGAVRLGPSPPPPIQGEIPRIVLWSQVITGLELDLDSGGIVRVLDSRTWRARRGRLEELGGPPTDLDFKGETGLDRYELLSHRLCAADCLRKGLWSQAAAHMNEVMDSIPGTWRDRMVRGRAHAHLAQWDEAEADLAAAIRLNPGVAQAWIDRGSIYIETGHREKAEADFRQAIALMSSGSNKQQRWAMSQWWVVGPYAKGLESALPPENQLDPARPVSSGDSLTGHDSSLRWRAESPAANGLLSVEELLQESDFDKSAYALTHIYSTADQDAALLVGSRGQLRIWVNGELVHENNSGRFASPDQDAVPITLRQGWNTLLAKVTKVANGLHHGLYLRMSDDRFFNAHPTGSERQQKSGR